MNRIGKFAALTTLSAVLCGGIAVAQDDHHDADQHQAYVRHSEWKKGYHMKKEDWDRGQQVDWRAHHLRQPPRGYEWREVDGNYVMAAIATGVIASAIVAAGH